MADKRKVLVVDDDVDLVGLIREYLEACGYETFEAFEGVRAIELVRKIKPDVILLDIMMPAGRGDEVMHNLHHHYETSNIPVIIISGVTDAVLQEKVMSEGAKIFLKKPFELDEVVEAIEKVIGKPVD